MPVLFYIWTLLAYEQWFISIWYVWQWNNVIMNCTNFGRHSWIHLTLLMLSNEPVCFEYQSWTFLQHWNIIIPKHGKNQIFFCSYFFSYLFTFNKQWYCSDIFYHKRDRKIKEGHSDTQRVKVNSMESESQMEISVSVVHFTQQ